MTSDFTQRQSVGEQMRAEELSLRATIPPAEVPGYRLERLLGQGAFGQVWVGKNLNTGRVVAVKFYLHRGGVNWSLLSREVKNLVSMAANRYIVQVLEVGWDAEPPYYVMEYLENGSLDEFIRARGAIPVHTAVDLFTDIATGLNHSHGKGVLHCDLKPANVLLDHDMRPRLADFGQSRLSHEQTPSLGTLFYMAPEQADLNALPDARWDVYALGAILYCMVVGVPPYRTPQMVTTLDTAASLPDRLKRYRDAILRSPAPRQHYRVRGMDRTLGSIIDRCLAKRADDRFENVQQVLEALKRRSIVRMRQPLMLLGIVGPLLLLIVMGFFSWRGIRTAERESSEQLREWALRSNEFAAKFASRTLETEMSGLFRVLEDEARHPELLEAYQQCRDELGPELLRSLATVVTPEAGRSVLLQNESRKKLEKHLTEQLKGFQPRTASEKKSVKFSSFFLNDEHGTQVAIGIAEPSESVVGRNFAYRSYFNGLRQDLPKESDRLQIKPIIGPHVSAPYQSTSTGRWKIAVSAPIHRDGDPEGEILGVLGLSINLGDFELLTDSNGGANKSEARRFAVLVDGYEGERGGTLVQHPGLAKLSGKQKFQIDANQLALLKTKGLLDYRDPLGKHEETKIYQGDWIAAMQQVAIAQLPSDGSTEANTNTDLWVLVQERAETVTEPVYSLGTKLFREGMVGLLSVIVVVCLLWFIVLYVIRIPDMPRESSGGKPGSDTQASEEITLNVE
jgi:eukaryotic-like serine/threonine-protein kinase